MEIVIVYGFMLLFIFSLSLLILLPAYLVLRKKKKRTIFYLFLIPIAMVLVSPSFSNKGQEIGAVHLEQQIEEHGHNVHLLSRNSGEGFMYSVVGIFVLFMSLPVTLAAGFYSFLRYRKKDEPISSL